MIGSVSSYDPDTERFVVKFTLRVTEAELKDMLPNEGSDARASKRLKLTEDTEVQETA